MIIIGASVFAFANCQVNAIISSTVPTTKEPVVEALTEKIRKKKKLNSEDMENLREFLKGENGVLVSVAAWCVYELGMQGNYTLHEDLPQYKKAWEVKSPDDVPYPPGGLAYTFVTLANAGKDFPNLTKAQRIELLKRIANADVASPYAMYDLKLEAIKRLLQIDKEEGRKFLLESFEATDRMAIKEELLRIYLSYFMPKDDRSLSVLSLTYMNENYGYLMNILEDGETYKMMDRVRERGMPKDSISVESFSEEIKKALTSTSDIIPKSAVGNSARRPNLLPCKQHKRPRNPPPRQARPPTPRR